MLKAQRDILAFAIWNTIEERVSYECTDLLMTKIVLNSFGTFSLIESNMKSRLVKEKMSLAFNNFNTEKKEDQYAQ